MHFRTGTYRLQVHRGFTLDDAAALADYLSDLGIGGIYLSPILESAPGSVHGYDTLDPREVSQDRGGEAAFDRLVAKAEAHRLDVVLDIVPNHLLAEPGNSLWRDVLVHGRASAHAHVFDINWDSPSPKLSGKVMLPILAEHYADALQHGKLHVTSHDGQFVLCYGNVSLPLSDESINELIGAESDAVDAINADIVRLDTLIERQHYRLAHWRLANCEINYRRFFAINSLAGVRVELPDVFDLMHRRALDWLRAGRIAGLRIDHPDGLADPTGYCEKLQAETGQAWIVVEKILGSDELLPADWPVAGTTGYDFLNKVSGLFVDPAGERAMTQFYARFTGETAGYGDVLRDCKRLVLDRLFAGEVDRLARLLGGLAAADARCRDVAAGELRDATCEMLACFPVYRNYIRLGRPVADADERNVRVAASAARDSRPDIYAGTFDLLTDLLLNCIAGERAEEFVLRFQQLSSPAMAKGAEDTAFYRYNRLVSLNEVGGDPGRFGVSLDTFHDYCLTMQASWPDAMLTTSTHDTKRSEDVRVRINVLSEMPDEWADIVTRWSAMNDSLRRGDAPSRNDEYLLYQTLVGVGLIEPDRLVGYMLKAIREARLRSNWDQPDQAYESAVESFVRGVLGAQPFTAEVSSLISRLTPAAQANSLAQTLLRCTVPGIPDIYQGNELWDFSLVDPDNRRPVDFQLRRQSLAELAGLDVAGVLARMDIGLPKMHVIRRCLAARRRLPEAFGPDGSYQPIWADGPRQEHVVSFVRGGWVIAIAPRLTLSLNGDWASTALPLPAGRWQDELTGQLWHGGRNVRLADLLSHFPVALLTR